MQTPLSICSCFKVFFALLLSSLLASPLAAQENLPQISNPTPSISERNGEKTIPFEKGKEYNILIFGSSAWHGMIDDFPEMAKADGAQVNIRCLRGEMDKFADALTAPPEDPKAFCPLETDYKTKVRVTDEIAAKKWDAVILHPRTTWLEPGEFRDCSKKLLDYFKEKQPQALVIMNENQSDRGDGIRNKGAVGSRGNASIKPASYRGKEFQYDMDTLHEDHHKAAKTVADELGIPIAPVGCSYHLAKTHPLWGYQFPDPTFDYEKAQPPALPKNTRSLWIGAVWKEDKKTGEKFLGFDQHKNNAGRYLQAAVFYEVVFGKNIVGNSYVPDSKRNKKGSDIDYGANIPLDAEGIKALQTIAHEAVGSVYPTLVK